MLKYLQRFLKEYGLFHLHRKIDKEIKYGDANIIHPFNFISWNCSQEGWSFWFVLSVRWKIFLLRIIEDLKDDDVFRLIGMTHHVVTCVLEPIDYQYDKVYGLLLDEEVKKTISEFRGTYKVYKFKTSKAK